MDKGLDAHNEKSAPPAFKVKAKFAVSEVTCKHPEILVPASGFSFANLSFINCKTGISLPAHSAFFLPWSAKPKSFISYFIIAPNLL